MATEQEIRAHWDLLHAKPGFAPRYPVDAVVRWLFRNFPRNRAAEFHLLDAGCGGGRHALLFAREGYRTAACDVSMRGLELLRNAVEAEGHQISLQAARVDALPYGDDSFDGVLAWGVFYYLPLEGYAAAASELKRVLKPGGHALVMVKSISDARMLHSEALPRNSFRVVRAPAGMPWENEIGVELTLLDRERIERLFGQFAEMQVENSRVTMANGRFADDDWHIYLCK
jgi:ubiquinone/menaquinone biosynthesis C-methylase UbiE